jgi:hypothetical protein
MYDCNDGLLHVNMYFEKLEKMAILFRYYDEKNWYAVEFDEIVE